MGKLHLQEATEILKFATTEASNSTSFLPEGVVLHRGTFYFFKFHSCSLLNTVLDAPF